MENYHEMENVIMPTWGQYKNKKVDQPILPKPIVSKPKKKKKSKKPY